MPYSISTNSVTTSATTEWELDHTIWCTWGTGQLATKRQGLATVGGTTDSTIVVQRSRTSNLMVRQHISSGTTSFTDAVVWGSWNHSTLRGLATNQMVRHFPQWTAEQIAEDREADIRAEAERAKAREKAEVLLRECLSPKQLEELTLHGHFHLETIAKSGERRRYRIERGRSRNVKQVSTEGRVIKTLCMHPEMAVPDADTMLAQKLYLEAAEDEFLRIANHS